MTAPNPAPQKRTILLLNGPNINLLGEREPHIYGKDSLKDIETRLSAQAKAADIQLVCRQSNHEGALIDAIQDFRNASEGLIINPGGYSHTSVALLDALKSYNHPIIEVHLSNPHQREDFRHHSYVSLVASGVSWGLGTDGYRLALDALLHRL